MMQLYARCRCGEAHPAALRDRARGVECVNCRGRAAGAPEVDCPWCGIRAPFHGHHVDGKKASDRIVIICRNCHAKHHSRFNQRPF